MNIFLFVFSRVIIMQLSIWTVATNVTSTTDTPEVNKTTNKFISNTFLQFYVVKRFYFYLTNLESVL